MSVHVLLNLLNDLRKRDKMRGYDIKITLKSHFCHKNVMILSVHAQRCYGCDNVSQKSVNH